MTTQPASHDRLLRALAEQLKLPLLHIARAAELGIKTGQEMQGTIMQTADMALQLIDGYLLTTDLHSQQVLELEPVSISAILHDTAQRLAPLAEQYGCEVDVHLSGKYAPVMAHRQSLEIAFTMLGYAFIEAGVTAGERRMILGAHRSKNGLVAGIFGDQPGLSTDMYRRARALYGTARQPFTSVTPAAGAGVFIADSLLSPQSSPLHVAYHQKLAGLAATLLPSHQLRLV
jgi:hypothetical protein